MFPATIKIIICFALILLLNRLRLPLSLSLFAGAVGLGFWSGLTPAELLSAVAESVRQWDTLYLIAIISLILLVSRLMERSGHLQRIVYAFILLVRDRRVVSALIPALIGILPMPGGALFSAPLVEKVSGVDSLKGEEKAMINYWFRHVWEYWWPLYPGFILAVSLLGVEFWKVMLVQFPLALFCVVSGVVFLLLPAKKLKRREGPVTGPESVISLLREVMPIILVVVTMLLFYILQHFLRANAIAVIWPSGTPVLLGLMVSVIWVVRENRLSFREIINGFHDRKFLVFIFLIVAIMIFKGILNQSGVVLKIKDELVAYRIPTLLIVVILPFVSGFVTGIAIGFVGASFPVILPLISGTSPLSYLATAALAYSFGYMGMMLSPVHLCFLVSKDYFKAGFPSSYRLLLKPVVLVLILSFLYFLILNGLGQ